MTRLANTLINTRTFRDNPGNPVVTARSTDAFIFRFSKRVFRFQFSDGRTGEGTVLRAHRRRRRRRTGVYSPSGGGRYSAAAGGAARAVHSHARGRPRVSVRIYILFIRVCVRASG